MLRKLSLGKSKLSAHFFNSKMIFVFFYHFSIDLVCLVHICDPISQR